MTHLPVTDNALVIRAEFSDDVAWESIKSEITAPVGDFRAYVDFVDDRELEGVLAEMIPSLIQPGADRSFVFIVDRKTFTHPDHPILVVDLIDEPGKTFRVIPSEMWSVENNLSLANLDFADFAESVDDEGIYRGF